MRMRAERYVAWTVFPVALLIGLLPAPAWADVLGGWMDGEAKPIDEAESTPEPSGSMVISDVIVQGSRRIPVEQIRARLKTRPGVQFSQGVLQDDVRALFKTLWFNNVLADTKADGRGRVKVIITVHDCPNTVEKVTYLGAKHISDDDLNQVTNVRKGMALNPHVNRQACLNITKRLNEDGRPFAHCELLKGGKDDDTEVVFRITEGPKVTIREAQYTGNTFFTAARLKDRLQPSLGLPPLYNLYDSKNSEEKDTECWKLEDHYRSFGFLDVRVTRELTWRPDGREVTPIFHITEGRRYRVQAPPEVSVPESLPHDRLQSMTKIRAKDWYDERKLRADIGEIEGCYARTGHKVLVQPTISRPYGVPGVVLIQYNVVDAAEYDDPFTIFRRDGIQIPEPTRVNLGTSPCSPGSSK